MTIFLQQSQNEQNKSVQQLLKKETFKDEIEVLTTNVYLQKTPGHTPEDISVIVKNTKDYNTVAISGRPLKSAT